MCAAADGHPVRGPDRLPRQDGRGHLHPLRPPRWVGTENYIHIYCLFCRYIRHTYCCCFCSCLCCCYYCVNPLGRRVFWSACCCCCCCCCGGGGGLLRPSYMLTPPRSLHIIISLSNTGFDTVRAGLEQYEKEQVSSRNKQTDGPINHQQSLTHSLTHSINNRLSESERRHLAHRAPPNPPCMPHHTITEVVRGERARAAAGGGAGGGGRGLGRLL